MHRPSLLSAIASIVIRLPLGFLIPFALFEVAWTFYLFQEVNELVQNFHLISLASVPLLWRLTDILISIFIITFYLAGALLAYNLAVLINWLLISYGPKRAPVAAVAPNPPPSGIAQHDRLQGVEKIGIVLAGGGAKGTFQAGAMKAIYQFLAENGALHKVKVISATSIGSWNALFWLTDLIMAENAWNQQSAHEKWWRSISLRSLLAPSWYVPCLRNAFFVTAPWQRQFDNLFGQAALQKKIVHSDIHFYFTSSHVRSGRLQCTTNNVKARDLPRVRFTCLDPNMGDDAFLEGVKAGVFASMDLPPLFPYMEMAGDAFEDGGVIDNLPVMFPAMESCDLIFVLPLNSDFVAEPDYRSLLSRFLRVMDVRQGALERGSLKTQYLYNELAVLRKYASLLRDRLIEAKIELPTIDLIDMSQTLEYSLGRKHKECRLFAICPQRTFVESTIDTQEFWKSREAGRAFAQMYNQSKFVLENDFNPKNERIEVALVDAGSTRWARDF